MKEFAKVVKQYPEATINIFGYTDSTGDADYNTKTLRIQGQYGEKFSYGAKFVAGKIAHQGVGQQQSG